MLFLLQIQLQCLQPVIWLILIWTLIMYMNCMQLYNRDIFLNTFHTFNYIHLHKICFFSRNGLRKKTKNGANFHVVRDLQARVGLSGCELMSSCLPPTLDASEGSGIADRLIGQTDCEICQTTTGQTSGIEDPIYFWFAFEFDCKTWN